MAKKPQPEKDDVFEKLRPNTQIMAKVRVGFGDGIYRTPEEIEKIKKKPKGVQDESSGENTPQ